MYLKYELYHKITIIITTYHKLKLKYSFVFLNQLYKILLDMIQSIIRDFLFKLKTHLSDFEYFTE